ncbi:hypothetical protein B0T24DRAFT_594371 [Lasiosphaeria ovina]|uniref:Uncharacterized protein n=1 Tax=Lasiosphaeria ovina TaxID=92902 RepID=A0AAE0KE27_9PEZI|nr:hypothetical protein B0T24DRAFT_594371 [Lasiosphaeria ovina]
MEFDPAKQPVRLASWDTSHSQRIWAGQWPARNDWKEGDIAFLKPAAAFTEQERDMLMRPTAGRRRRDTIPEKATDHPVIILRRLSEKSTHVMVATVSVYRCSDATGYTPPWKQEFHRHKLPEDFRAFDGCERSSTEYEPLYLQHGCHMPKPRASWVYIHIWAVPLTVISGFNKARHLLRKGCAEN